MVLCLVSIYVGVWCLFGFKVYSFYNISICSRLLLQRKLCILPLALVSASFVGPSGVCVVLAESGCGVYA